MSTHDLLFETLLKLASFRRSTVERRQEVIRNFYQLADAFSKTDAEKAKALQHRVRLLEVASAEMLKAERALKYHGLR